MNRGLPIALATMLLLAGCVIAPGASLARYSRVMFDNVAVGFKPDWQTRNPRLSGHAAQTADARAAFATWAGHLRDALDEARKPPPK